MICVFREKRGEIDICLFVIDINVNQINDKRVHE